MSSLSTEKNTAPKPRQPYTPPEIQTEPLFESDALESAAKSGRRCRDIDDPCFSDCGPRPS